MLTNRSMSNTLFWVALLALTTPRLAWGANHPDTKIVAGDVLYSRVLTFIGGVPVRENREAARVAVLPSTHGLKLGVTVQGDRQRVARVVDRATRRPITLVSGIVALRLSDGGATGFCTIHEPFSPASLEYFAQRARRRRHGFEAQPLARLCNTELGRVQVIRAGRRCSYQLFDFTRHAGDRVAIDVTCRTRGKQRSRRLLLDVTKRPEERQTSWR